MIPTNNAVSQEIEKLLQRNDREEIERFIRNPPLEIEEDERLHQKVVVLHDRIGSIDPLVSAHVFWQMNKRSVILERRHLGQVAFTVTAGSVLDHLDASYVVAACDSMLDPTNFPKSGLMQHIQRLEGMDFFEGNRRPNKPLDFLGLWEVASIKRQFRYLFVNLEENARCNYQCTLDDVLRALTDCLNHVARATPQGAIVALPTLGWRYLKKEHKEPAAREMLRLIEQFCKKGEAGQLKEVRLSLYSLEAAFAFAKTLAETKQQHIEVLNTRLADARNLASERTNLIYDYHSTAFKQVREEIDAQLQSVHPIVFVGEAGVGKKFFGAYVHSHGPRNDQPFLVAGVRESLDSDRWKSLIGRQTDDASGTTIRPPDKFLAANNGTLLVKHLEQMPTEVQEFIVDFIDEGIYYPAGSISPKSVDVRLLFASLEPLSTLRESNRLIPDLYHRLQPHVIELPPLRKRREDIMPIANMWLNIYRDDFGYQVAGFNEDVKATFLSYDWPGNVSELQSVVQNAVVRARGGMITLQHASLQLLYADEVPSAFAKKGTLLTDYLELRRRYGDDWSRVNEEINGAAHDIIQQILRRKSDETSSLAALLKKYAIECGWPPIWRVLVARRVILGVFTIRKRKWPRSKVSTINLLGYVEESELGGPRIAQRTRGAFNKYLSDLGLTQRIIDKQRADDLFPEEVHMIEGITRWRMNRPK